MTWTNMSEQLSILSKLDQIFFQSEGILSYMDLYFSW